MTQGTQTVVIPKSMESLLKEYAKLKASEKVAKARAAELSIDIVSDFHANKLESKLSTDFGTFSLGVRNTYLYSKKTTELEKQVRQLKKNEEDSGKVKIIKTTEYLSHR